MEVRDDEHTKENYWSCNITLDTNMDRPLDMGIWHRGGIGNGLAQAGVWMLFKRECYIDLLLYLLSNLLLISKTFVWRCFVVCISLMR